MTEEYLSLTPNSEEKTSPPTPAVQIVLHRHIYTESGDKRKLVCSICGKSKLNLKNTSERGILEGIKSNGQKYTVRDDRKRYLFPNEWFSFINGVNNHKHKLFYLTAIHTGGRAMEILHLKAKDFDFERSTISFRVVKQRKAKKNFASLGKTRTFFVSEKYMKEVKKHLKDIDPDPETYIFMDKNSLPADYENLPNPNKKKYYSGYEVAYSQMLKRHLKKCGIVDWKQISLHNLRKTYGNWMRVFDIKTEEICYRLGHDFNTYLMHYGSPLIFTPQERQTILSIYGELR